MAKRRRLEVPEILDTPVLETKSAFGLRPAVTRPPIADVAGATAGQAAAEEMARALEDARAEGRLVQNIAIDDIDMQSLHRDRQVIDEDEFRALTDSIAQRGQQTPVEVMKTGRGFGLISGQRRILALRELGRTEVLALVRQPADGVAPYVAMVEENEIRADLSFWERAGIARRTTEAGVFPDTATAVATLYANASKSRRSKIASFVLLEEKFSDHLRFGHRIPEKLGVALAAAIRADARVALRLVDALRKTPPRTAEAERQTLERAMTAAKGPATAKAPRPEITRVASGVTLEVGEGRVVVKGRGVDATLAEDLRKWLVSRAKP